MLLAASATIFATTAAADTIRCPPSLDQYAGGQCGFIHRSRPESWVRGSAALDTSTGVLTFTIQLTTYSKTAGPCGKLTALLLDAQGSDLIRVTMGRAVCRGGRRSAPEVTQEVTLQKSLPPTIALRAKSVVVAIEYSGVHLGDWNVTLQDIASAIQMLVIAVG
jgi:hypothetical protein